MTRRWFLGINFISLKKVYIFMTSTFFNHNVDGGFEDLSTVHEVTQPALSFACTQ